MLTVEVITRCLDTRQATSHLSEQLLLILLPYLLDGLKAKKCADFQISCYMIVSQLCARTSLEQRTFEALLLAVVKSVPFDAISEEVQKPLLCVLHLFQSQNAVATIPDAAFRSISEWKSLPEALSSVVSNFDCFRFLDALTVTLARFCARKDFYRKLIRQYAFLLFLAASHSLSFSFGFLVVG